MVRIRDFHSRGRGSIPRGEELLYNNKFFIIIIIYMIKKYLLLSFILVSIDYVYLKLISKFFNKQIKMVQGSPIKLDMPGAILCYLFLSLGFSYFLIKLQK